MTRTGAGLCGLFEGDGRSSLFSSQDVTAAACCSGAAGVAAQKQKGRGEEGSEEKRYIVWYIVWYIVTIL